MTLEEAIVAIRSAPDKGRAQMVANDIAIACMRGERDAGDELAVRHAWYERWGHELMQSQVVGDCGPRPGANWTGD